ncbi:hypothetical protein COU58_00565 [Candidatus Pacearchaeota archaeon CG10_big_fil_rev_8_21_14_0_10_32_42]|nr:MAG: hypothetical protein COU58_00565 [Candidatus Pacearchaeota archaeon CG10_big_fil_rev_8_21_14_0_10_32_42]
MILLDLRWNPSEFMNDKIILSFDDFFNENSVFLAQKYGLGMREIPKNFLELSEERKSSQFKTIAELSDPLNFYYCMAQKFASSAIVRYELINRSEIYFIYDSRVIFVKDLYGPEFQIKMAKRDDFFADEMKRRHFEHIQFFKD